VTTVVQQGKVKCEVKEWYACVQALLLFLF